MKMCPEAQIIHSRRSKKKVEPQGKVHTLVSSLVRGKDPRTLEIYYICVFKYLVAL